MALVNFLGNLVVGGTISKVGGLPSQFLKADGSVDINSYQTIGSSFNIGTTLIANNRASGAQTLTGVTVDGNAPISGSANYIQNQNASAQSANMWVSGTGKFGNGINVTGISALGSTTYLYGYLTEDGNGNRIYTANNGGLDFWTNGASAFNVKSTTRNFLIGTTADNGVDKLQVNGSIRSITTSDPGTGTITSKILSYAGQPYGLHFRGYSSGVHSIQSQREGNDSILYPLSLQPLGGSLLVGSTTDAGYKLDVTGTTRFSDGDFTLRTSTVSIGAAISSPKLILSGSIWNSATGATTMSGGIQVMYSTFPLIGNNKNPSISKLSFLVGSDGAVATEQMFLNSNGALGVNGGIILNAPSQNNTFNITLDNTALATNTGSAGWVKSNKLVLKGKTYTSTEGGSSRNMGFLQMLGVSGNSNPTIDKLSFFVGSSSNLNTGDVDGNATERLAIQTDGIFKYFNLAGTEVQRLVGSTGNLILQNGGTFTDDGINRLQVTGSAKMSATFGAELAPALTSGNWSVTGGMVVSGSIAYTTGTIASATPVSAIIPAIGDWYKITWTVTGGYSANNSINFGGVNFPLQVGTYTVYANTVSTSGLTISALATTNQSFTLTALSILKQTANTGGLTVEGPVTMNNTLDISRVGIGTLAVAPTAPLQVVDINGNAIRVTRNGVPGQYISMHEAGGAVHTIETFGDKPFRLNNNTSTNFGIEFYTQNIYRGQFTGTGNLLVGTSTDAGYRLDVTGTARVSGAITLNNLVGTGTRPVTVSSTGVLSVGGITTLAGYGITDAASSSLSYFIGTTANTLNRASGAQTLTGVSIDGNAYSASYSAVSDNAAEWGPNGEGAYFNSGGNTNPGTLATLNVIAQDLSIGEYRPTNLSVLLGNAFLSKGGGTLTGPLNGTSATFSSSVTATTLIINSGIGDGDTYNTNLKLLRTSSTGNILGARIVLDDLDTNYADLKFKVKTTGSSSESDSYYTDALTLKGSNGSATFSSSVTAGNGVFNVANSTTPHLMVGGAQGAGSYGTISGAGGAAHGLILRGIPLNGGVVDHSVTAGDQMSFFEYGGDFRFYKKDGALSLVAQITSTGVTALAFFANSDIRLKDVIEKENTSSNIQAISYTWKDKSKGEKVQVGYSAQEVQKYMPDAVDEDEDGMLSVNYIQVLVAKVEALEKQLKQLQHGI